MSVLLLLYGIFDLVTLLKGLNPGVTLYPLLSSSFSLWLSTSGETCRVEVNGKEYKSMSLMFQQLKPWGFIKGGALSGLSGCEDGFAPCFNLTIYRGVFVIKKFSLKQFSY